MSEGLTKDDERARRLCSLALEFMNAGRAVSSSDVARHFYPALSQDSFRRAFSRDRAALAACGVVVREVPRPGEDSAWEVDGDASFVNGAQLSPREAAELEIACQPLLDDAEFPLVGELRFALAKLTRSFAERSLVVPAARRGEPRPLSAIREALVDGRALELSYTDARGRSSVRTVAPYGLFGLREALYLVACKLDDAGEPVEGGTRTYRVDRVEAARVLSGVPTAVPADFSVDDWRRLPFQMGSDALIAVFEVPADRADDLRRACGGQGELVEDDGRLLWRVGASSAGDAASWAVAQGIVPLEPDSLVTAWKDVLEGVLEDVR